MATGYRVIDHTGDLGVEVEAPDFAELIRQASLALTDTLVDLKSVGAGRTARWTVEAGSEEGLLVAQLQEILFRMDAEGMVFSDFKIDPISARSLGCIATGEPLDRERHGFKTEIKAVTYHGLEIETREGKKIVRIIFDV
ncbi:MAG TPA: archease [bacterium]|nr:archease [bacterium]